MISRALFVRLEAKTGHEEEVESFLRSALDIVDTEDGTPLWLVLRFGPSTFGIFDAFPDEDARETHLSGQVAAGLKEKAPELLAQEPTIERIDVLRRQGRRPGAVRGPVGRGHRPAPTAVIVVG
jgi:quinol monooxygenase YgiN